MADVVQSIVRSELERIKQEVRSAVAGEIAGQIQTALRAAIGEEFVRDIATKAAEKAQADWVEAQLQKIVAESVRAALIFEMDQRRREFTVLVLGEIEAAMRGPITARIDARLEEHARKHPPITEEAARRVAAEVAEKIQIEWARTKLPEAVRAALEGDAAKETGAS